MWTQYSYKNMDEVIPTKEERITKIVNALKTTPKGKLSYDRDPSSPPILALSPKTENKENQPADSDSDSSDFSDSDDSDLSENETSDGKHEKFCCKNSLN